MDKIIKEPKWEKFLLDNQPDNKFKDYYKERLSQDNKSYWQILAEMETVYLFHYKLGVPIIDINKKTIRNKDVDLFTELKDNKIYIEITASRYKEEKNSDEQQDAKFERALEHADKKFLDNSINLLVFYDEQLYSSFYDPEFMMSDTINNYFNSDFFERKKGYVIDLRKISGLLFFGGRNHFAYERKFETYKNENANRKCDIVFDLINENKFYKNSYAGTIL